MGVDELMGEDLGSLSGAELSARVVALEEARDRLEAARLALVGEWDARGEWAADGASSAKAWIAAHGRSSLAQAGGLVATARKLRAHMPITAAWVADGRLAPAKARLLAGAVNARTAEVFAGHEQLLVELAAAHTVDETAAMMRHW